MILLGKFIKLIMLYSKFCFAYIYYYFHLILNYPEYESYHLFACRTLDKTISNLEMELAAARAAQESIVNGSPISEDLQTTESSGRKRYLMVVGINTAFSSRKRRDSVRATWMPQGSWAFLCSLFV